MGNESWAVQLILIVFLNLQHHLHQWLLCSGRTVFGAVARGYYAKNVGEKLVLLRFLAYFRRRDRVGFSKSWGVHARYCVRVSASTFPSPNLLWFTRDTTFGSFIRFSAGPARLERGEVHKIA